MTNLASETVAKVGLTLVGGYQNGKRIRTPILKHDPARPPTKVNNIHKVMGMDLPDENNLYSFDLRYAELRQGVAAMAALVVIVHFTYLLLHM